MVYVFGFGMVGNEKAKLGTGATAAAAARSGAGAAAAGSLEAKPMNRRENSASSPPLQATPSKENKPHLEGKTWQRI